MNDSRKGKFYALIFLFFLIFLVVGGYFLTKSLMREEKKESKTTDTTEKMEENNLKLNKNEDYIYFENSENYSTKLEITYQDVNININGDDSKLIETTLNDEMKALKDSLKRISDQKLSEEDKVKVVYEIDDIYEANYRTYTRYFANDYASLLIDNYHFDCFNGSSYNSSKAYVFDINTGKWLTNEELMNRFDMNIEKIKMAVQSKLEGTKNDDLVIDIIETLKSFENEENYTLYVNKSGLLVISYIVKTDNSRYNDVIIFN